MKSMMKKTLSVIIALAMILVPMSVFAAQGDYDEPYQLIAGGEILVVYLEAGASAYVQADDCDGSTVTVGYATNDGYFIQYGVHPIYPEADATATFTMNSHSDLFSVNNSGEEAVTVYMALESGAGAPAGTWDNPEVVTLEDPWGMGSLSAYMTTELEEGNQGYYYTVTAPADGAIGVSVSAFDSEYNDVDWQFQANNVTSGVYGDMLTSCDEEVVYTYMVPVSAGDVVEVFVATFNPENMWNNPAANVGVNFGFFENGSSEYPEATDVGEHSTYITAGSWGYYYTYTATEAGVLTATMNDASGWQYQINVAPASGDWSEYYYGDPHTYADEPVVSSESVEMVAGDVATICICTFNPEDEWNAPAGTVNWTLAFEAGATLGGEGGEGGDIGGGDIGGGDIGGGDEGGEDVNYVNNGEYLQVGDNMCVVDAGYEYTIYTFEPTEDGNYTFTSSDSVMGIVSYNGMWITVEPSADTVNANEFTWECTAVGQSIWVAVKADTNIANINITREDLAPVVEVPWTIYENVVTPENFTFEGNADELVYVDVEDETVDTAVLGEDGYYHLNSADGEILYVSLDDALVSMLAAQSYGQLIYVEQDEDLVVLSKTDYNDAFAEYAACADEETMLYPLTVDLMEMLKSVGTHQGWYLENGYAGTSEDAWMFLCYYVPAAEDGGNQGGNEGGNVPNPEIPNTGAEVFGVAFAMMATAAALGATVVTTKKSKRVK